MPMTESNAIAVGCSFLDTMLAIKIAEPELMKY